MKQNKITPAVEQISEADAPGMNPLFAIISLLCMASALWMLIIMLCQIN
jgi:hypothetical protein